MKARRKKLMALIMAAVMTVSAALPVFGATESGEEPVILKGDIADTACGENLKYSYTESTKTLYIKGFGKMEDYYNSGTSFTSQDIEFLDMSGASDMTHIGNYAFSSRPNLTAAVNIPDKVESIGYFAFYGTKITSFTLNSRLKTIGERAFSAYEGIKTLTGGLTLPGSLTEIGKNAFYGDEGLTGSLTIPKSLTSLGEGAFYGCSGFNGLLTFENGISLEEIPKDAFRGCKFFGKMSIPGSVKTIGEKAFMACPSLNEIYIPSGVESIAKDAFDDCPNINKITFDGTSGDWYTKGFGDVKGLNESYVEKEFLGGNKVAVSFDSCGGSPVEKQAVEYGGLFKEPEAPEKPRCEFRGWYTAPDYGGTKWDFSKDKASVNITLYAAWYQEDCLVTFNSMGGSKVESRLVKLGEAVERPSENPVKSGAEFQGWYKDEACTEIWNFENKVNGDLTLYAKWLEQNNVTVEFHYDKDRVETITVPYNSLIPKPEDPESQGYVFNGWYTIDLGGDPIFYYWDFDKDVVKKDTALFAAWDQGECLVYFNSLGGSLVEPQLVKPGEKAVEPSAPLRSGSEFLGWYLDRTFTTKWSFDTAVMSNLTLYAKWSGVNYEEGISYFVITASAGYGGDISPEEGVLVPEGSEQKFTIKPWDGFFIRSVSVDGIDTGTDDTYTFAGVTGDHTIEAFFTSTNGDIYDDGKSFYTISANAGEGGSITPNGSVIVNKYSNITFDINASEGYRVSNVMVDGKAVGGVTQYTFKKVMADHAIGAGFIANNPTGYCKVEFVADGAEENIEPMYLPKDSKVPKPADPVKKGYVFKGWFKFASYLDAWDFEKDTVTLTAKHKVSEKDESSTKIYACFIPEDKSKSPICLKSSTEKFGMWVETVIGKGCTQKLYLANSDGKMLDKNSRVTAWNIIPYGDSDNAGLDKFFDEKKLKKGILKCKKQAPLGYQAMVYTTYNGTTLRYIVTVVDKVKKMGYTDASGKFRKNITVTLSDNRCDFGYGPQHFLDTPDKYIEIYNKNRVKTGTILYEQPDDSYWSINGKTPDEPFYLCSIRIPDYAGITSREVTDPATGKKKKLYFFDAYYTGKIKKYKLEFLSPDGSGKKFTVTIKQG